MAEDLTKRFDTLTAKRSEILKLQASLAEQLVVVEQEIKEVKALLEKERGEKLLRDMRKDGLLKHSDKTLREAMLRALSMLDEVVPGEALPPPAPATPATSHAASSDVAVPS